MSSCLQSVLFSQYIHFMNLSQVYVLIFLYLSKTECILIFQSQIGIQIPSEQCQYFEDAVNNLFDCQASFVDSSNTDDKFNVLCHGDLWMQNVVFSYGSCLGIISHTISIITILGHKYLKQKLGNFCGIISNLLHFIF